MKVSAIQCRIGDLGSAERLSLEAIEKGAELLLYPEYFSYPTFSLELGEITLEFLQRISREYSVITSGNIVFKGDRITNRAFIFDSGDLIGYQDKVHPTRNEKILGITPGEKLSVFNIRKSKICVLVCADILYPELCRIAGLKGAEIALNPVVSFKYSELPGENLRFCLYFARSFDNGYAIVKAGGFGKTFTGSEALGRSLIASFDGILARSKGEESEEAVMAEIDLKRMRSYRQINYSLIERNVEAYRDLFEKNL
ncbi:MAG: carbon-nitrogen hydrolase family protein [Archaeoglobaceae archaeon]|nr:carbon-nitrogen hydrolase family protein [Archaeoglobaceae archaeon]MDW8118343.1 carbon-nitrogen hydrolase family protein [Archaeoglobaceae archaeon]